MKAKRETEQWWDVVCQFSAWNAAVFASYKDFRDKDISAVKGDRICIRRGVAWSLHPSVSSACQGGILTAIHHATPIPTAFLYFSGCETQPTYWDLVSEQCIRVSALFISKAHLSIDHHHTFGLQCSILHIFSFNEQPILYLVLKAKTFIKEIFIKTQVYVAYRHQQPFSWS